MAEHKLLAVLRFCACGNFQQTAADYIGISQQTFSRILDDVCEALREHLPIYIHMPRNDDECRATAAEFAKVCDFPMCIGAVDGTHVKISMPSEHVIN